MRPLERPFIPPDVDERLREWARWATRRSWPSASCGSAESRYRPEAGDTWEGIVDKPLPLDERLAWAIECAWRNRLPDRPRALLKAYYITGPSKQSPSSWYWHVRATCKRLGMSLFDWPTEVSAAAMSLDRLSRILRE